MTVTARQIREQIAATDRILADLENTANALSFDAVSGDSASAASLLRVNHEIERTRADSVVLRRALVTAESLERVASDQAAAVERANHLDDARDKASLLQRHAQKADELIAEMKAVLADIDGTEAMIWTSLSRAGYTPPGAILGRRGLSAGVLAALGDIVNGRAKFRTDTKSTVDVARVAWQFLSDEGGVV